MTTQAAERSPGDVLAPYLHQPGARVDSIARLVRELWLHYSDVDLRRRYYSDVDFHAHAFHAAYIVAGLLLVATMDLVAAGADTR